MYTTKTFDLTAEKPLETKSRRCCTIIWVSAVWFLIMVVAGVLVGIFLTPTSELGKSTEIGKKAWLFAKLQPGRARK